MGEFYKNGISAVKMDEIARRLSISKRTLYEIYSNKEELLFEGVRRDEDAFHTHMTDYAADHDVIEIINEYNMLQLRRLSEVSPQFFTDIHKYSQIVAYLAEVHERHGRNALAFFNNGVAQGYFRSDIDYEVLHHMGNAAMQYVMQNELYRTYSIDYIFRNVVIMFLRGVCTQKGIEKFDSLIERR